MVTTKLLLPTVVLSLLLLASLTACGGDDSREPGIDSTTTISDSSGSKAGSDLPSKDSEAPRVEVEVLAEPEGRNVDVTQMDSQLDESTNVPTAPPTGAVKGALSESIRKLNIFDAVISEDLESVQWHIEAGTNLEAPVPPGWPWAGASPLHLAAVVGNEEIVQLLLAGGVDIDLKASDSFAATPLQWAVFFGVVEMTAFLVNAGADINAEDAYGCSVLCSASSDNPWVDGTDGTFKNDRDRIRRFLKAEGAKK